jgi:adenine deaminase
MNTTLDHENKLLKVNLIDLHQRRSYLATIEIVGNKIFSIIKVGEYDPTYPCVLPGFIDAHVHIESSMLIPEKFAEQALKFGTVATVSDPHEIANVLGIEGVRFMVESAARTPMKIYFGAPSCVPATGFETAGAVLEAGDLEVIFDTLPIRYLAEMMNYPGVIYEEPSVLAKLDVAKKRNLPIDGHSPGIRGELITKYFSKGITTDHECYLLEEAIEKAEFGVKILIREGSAAKNYEELKTIIKMFPSQVMFCSDDKHPDDLLKGHINELVKRAIRDGFDSYDVLRAACIHPVEHYNLDVGMLREGDPADFIVIDNLESLEVLQTWIDGTQVWPSSGLKVKKNPEIELINQFISPELTIEDLRISVKSSSIRCIKVLDGELITQESIFSVDPLTFNGYDVDRDILKIVVINRYSNAAPSVACIHGFGLQSGAIASSVAHDCHNIIAVGTNDQDLLAAIQVISDNQGGICAVNGNDSNVLPLPIAGLMSSRSCAEIGYQYSLLDQKAKEWGSALRAPYMSLSFMALLVIPALKLSDKGLFDGNKFQFVSLEVED